MHFASSHTNLCCLFSKNIYAIFFFPPLSLSPPRPAQNNNRGGYNAGDQDTGAFDSEDEIYYMVRLLISLDCFFKNMEIRSVLDGTDLWGKIGKKSAVTGTQLAWAASTMYDHWATTRPDNSLHVLHRWYQSAPNKIFFVLHLIPP